jgi:hypothetical protein
MTLKTEHRPEKQREAWAEPVFRISLGWLIIVLPLIAAQGLGRIRYWLALVTTTTANILGTLAIVLRFIFPERR